MHRTVTILMALALVALVAMPLMAQDTARSIGMGNSLLLTSDDELAATGNPAALPHLDVFGEELQDDPARASLTLGLDMPGNLDYWAISAAGRDAEGVNGYGVNYGNYSGGGETMAPLAIGYGRQVGPQGLSVGINLVNISMPTGVDDQTMIGLGLMHRQDLPEQTVRYGLLLADLFDDSGHGPYLHVGASVTTLEGITAAATIFDLTNEVDTILALGVEWLLPESDATLRGGLHDGDLTLGAGYRFGNFDLSLGWADTDGGDTLLLTATGCF